MTGGQQRFSRRGSRTESLAQTVLKTIAFTTPVPREEDVGHDLYCVLSETKGAMCVTGPFFTVQVKSNREPVVFQKDHELAWIREQQNPYFIAVCLLQERQVDIYSTWKRLQGILAKGADRIVLVPGHRDEACEQVWTAEDRSEQRIPLGKPVVSVTLDQMVEEAQADRIRAVLKEWVEIDLENIVNSRAGMYWLTGPADYTTNHPIGEKRRGVFLWNRANLPRCLINFGRAGTALRLVLREELQQSGERVPPYAAQIRDLENVLRSYAENVEPWCMEILKQRINLDMSRTPHV